MTLPSMPYAIPVNRVRLCSKTSTVTSGHSCCSLAMVAHPSVMEGYSGSQPVAFLNRSFETRCEIVKSPAALPTINLPRAAGTLRW